MKFALNDILSKDSFFIQDLEICRLLLSNNRLYPWFILVPKINNAIELTDLEFEDQVKILHEINVISDILQKTYNPYKLNIATLGNQVRQLHIHIIARFKDDDAWPNPIWHYPKEPYKNESEVISIIKRELKKRGYYD